MEDKIALITASDQNYLENLGLTLIYSLGRHCPKLRLTYYVVLNAEEELSDIYETPDNVTLVPICLSQQEQASKFLLAVWIWRWHIRDYDNSSDSAGSLTHTIYVDADMVIRKPLVTQLSRLTALDRDIFFLTYPNRRLEGPAGTDLGAVLNNGFLIVRWSEKTRAFIERYVKLVQNHCIAGGQIEIKSRGVTACIDQEFLATTVISCGLKVYPLAKNLNDSTFIRASYVWHAKGTKKSHYAYIAEKHEYLEQKTSLALKMKIRIRFIKVQVSDWMTTIKLVLNEMYVLFFLNRPNEGQILYRLGVASDFNFEKACGCKNHTNE